MNDDIVLDMSAESHHTVLDDPDVTGAVAAALDEVGSGCNCFRFAVVQNKSHRYASSQLSILAVRTDSSTTIAIDDLHFASRNGGAEAEELVLGLRGGEIPLHIVVERERFGVVDFLLSTNIQPPPDILFSAFYSSHRYLRECRTEIIRALVNHGTDLHACNADGKTPLHLAVEGG
ncbi:hypothetical protein HYDPIDRAFT_30968 [Hydnomerulius pinastri MD-312]|uniref:Ankyrin n=1 Tax=Hydnomerulius pinastri MD-312 TaxID=994086 RepID=A0A0C9WCT7_9AGAM|nr:hypothetical protein HYDPIDRAFT_30968 [Hydnomerulius pinastri MD-312]